MHDIRMIRDNPAAFDTAMARRGLSPISSEILAVDEARRSAIAAAETALATRNAASKEVGAAKARGDDAEFERLRALVAAKKDEVATMETASADATQKLTALLEALPNLPFDDTPDGKDETDNIEMHRWGTPRSFNFEPREHYVLEPAQALMDFATAGVISGARFVVLKGTIARLHRALAQFMLDTHINEHGLTEVNAPVLVRPETMYGTGQLPKFAEDSYETTNGWWLIPTSEVTLTSIPTATLGSSGSLDGADLPIRMTAHSLCFRSEAGSAGKDTAGMLRQHQFEKVEMVSLTKPEDSRAELDRMTKCAESILERLELPYRTIVLCTGDMGFGARRTHDIEVWLPGQNTYREISSCSVCGDFQARRMNARFRPAEGAKPEFVHTLNGSGLAVGRCLIAVLENYQQADGAVIIPEVLRRYMGDKTQILADGTLA